MVSAVIVFGSLIESRPLLEISMYIVGDVFNQYYIVGKLQRHGRFDALLSTCRRSLSPIVGKSYAACPGATLVLTLELDFDPPAEAHRQYPRSYINRNT